MLEHAIAILSGAVFVLAVIAGIGPQNLNIISHAIKRNHAREVAITSFLADITLILVGGIGLSLAGTHSIIFFINVVGIVFIVWYLYYKVTALFKPRSELNIEECHDSRNKAILRALALTWLNPLVFIDTIVVIGGTSSHYTGLQRVDFLVGALVGDFIWIFGVAFIAKRFSAQLNRKSVWIALDVTTIIIMAYILYKTVAFVIA